MQQGGVRRAGQGDERRGLSALVRSRTLTALVTAGLLLAGCSGDPSPGGQAAGAVRAPGLPGAATSSTAAPCTVPRGLARQELSRLPVTDKVIALTFDAGANADGVPSIRATLGRMQVKATFFLTGSFVKAYPVRSRRLADRDLVGNHTMTHRDLTTLSDRQVRHEVRDAAATIRTTTGEDPRRFFRFPYGARSDHLITLLNAMCYVPFRWTVDTLGWKGTSGGQTAATVVSRVVNAAAPGAIVLMHVGSNPDDHSTLDADALPEIVTRLRALGYHFVRLSRVMSDAP
jgi:peptidoglycan/xylan/chitin deacetylase (PgdA/CDA1 family)